MPSKGLVRFGKMRGLRRVFAAIAQIVGTLDKPGGRLVGQAQCTQLLKALCQVSLDKGSWRVAWKFLSIPDPYLTALFGGCARELEVISAELKAEDDLKARLRKGTASVDSGTDDDPAVDDAAGDGAAPADGEPKRKKKPRKKKKE